MNSSTLEKLSIGDTLQLSKHGMFCGLQGRAATPTGTVIDIKPPYAIEVLRDGLKRPDWYHVTYWDAPHLTRRGG